MRLPPQAFVLINRNVHTPVCGSSRTCVATGRLPHENGVLTNGMSILPNIPTLGKVFCADGYHTAWTVDGICRRWPYYDESIFTLDWDEQTWRSYLHSYYRLTEIVDIEVGQVLAALHASGQDENTIVILTSNHGESMVAHQSVAKLGLYKETLCVSLILSQPGTIDNTPSFRHRHPPQRCVTTHQYPVPR